MDLEIKHKNPRINKNEPNNIQYSIIQKEKKRRKKNTEIKKTYVPMFRNKIHFIFTAEKIASHFTLNCDKSSRMILIKDHSKVSFTMFLEFSAPEST
jgi:hypothetical protein